MGLLKKGKTSSVQAMKKEVMERDMEKKALENHIEKKELTQKEMAALKIKAKEEEKAFNERMLLAIEKEEKMLPEKVEKRKKKALELGTAFEENAVKAKKELSVA